MAHICAVQCIFMFGNKRYQKYISQTNTTWQKILGRIESFQIYPQRFTPAGVQSTLEMVKVVVKEVEVEMEVVVIQ